MFGDQMLFRGHTDANKTTLINNPSLPTGFSRLLIQEPPEVLTDDDTGAQDEMTWCPAPSGG